MARRTSEHLIMKKSVNGGIKSKRLSRTDLVRILKDIEKSEDITNLRREVEKLGILLTTNEDISVRGSKNENNHDIDIINRSFLNNELLQIQNAITIERAKYYVKRLIHSFTETRTNGINEINLNRWKEYKDVLTDSLWNFKKRDNSGVHLGWYWGNFIPQIPHQAIVRYTRKGDWILDPFAGSGTTLIECIRLGRNSIGVELDRNTSLRAKLLLEKEDNKLKSNSEIVTGNSTAIDFVKLIEKRGIHKVQLIILHPPYYNIIKFDNNPKNLSNSQSIHRFLKRFNKVVTRTAAVLQDGGYLILVAGDKYEKGEWIPLGFQMMETVLKNGYRLIGIVVKNFEDTKAKRKQKELWRYRALAGGFYVFKHEYIFIFRKMKKQNSDF